MKKINLVVVLTILSMSFTACRSQNPAATGTPNAAKPPIERPVEQKESELPTFDDIDARVDIMFVIDNSGSMGPHVKNLSNNINKFVAGLAKNKTIDFHIGFTVIHDPTRYGTVVKQTCGSETNWEDPGTLKTLKGPKAPRDRRYVTRDDDFETVLRDSFNPSNPESLKDLVKEFVMPTKENPGACPSGPQEEDSFTPLLGALNNPVLANGPNAGFRRDGAFFVAILVSDAKDASNKTPEEVYSELAQLTGQTTEAKRRFRVFAVAFKEGTWIGQGTVNHTQCKPDPAFSSGKINESQYAWPKRQITAGENPLAELAKLTQDGKSIDQVLSICDKSFGSTLAKFGTQIQQDTLADIVLQLNRRPSRTDDPAKRLAVYIGDVRLPGGSDDIPREERLWSYNPNTLTVTVYGRKIDWDKYANDKLRVSYTPAIDSADTTKPVFTPTTF